MMLWLLVAALQSGPAPMAHLLEYRDLAHECLWPLQLMAILVLHSPDQLYEVLRVTSVTLLLFCTFFYYTKMIFDLAT